MWKLLHENPSNLCEPNWSTFIVDNQVVYRRVFSKGSRRAIYIGGINDSLEENVRNAAQLSPWYDVVYTLDHNSIGNIAEQIDVWSALVERLVDDRHLVGTHLIGESMGTLVTLHLLQKFHFESCVLESPFWDAREISWTLECLPEWFEEAVAGLPLVSPTQNLQVDRMWVCIRNQDPRVPPSQSEKLIEELGLCDNITVLYHDGNHEFQLCDFFGPDALL